VGFTLSPGTEHRLGDTTGRRQDHRAAPAGVGDPAAVLARCGALRRRGADADPTVVRNIGADMSPLVSSTSHSNARFDERKRRIVERPRLTRSPATVADVDHGGPPVDRRKQGLTIQLGPFDLVPTDTNSAGAAGEPTNARQLGVSERFFAKVAERSAP
jgi:hypothetical protein